MTVVGRIDHVRFETVQEGLSFTAPSQGRIIDGRRGFLVAFTDNDEVDDVNDVV